MSAVEPNIPALLVFAVAWLICCAGFFYLSAMFPLSAAPLRLRSGAGSFLIVLDAALLVVLFALTLLFSYRELRWSSMIVAGGVIFLFAPFVTQDVPDRLKNRKTGLLLLLLFLLLAFGLLLGAAGRLIPAGV